jgi:PilZ domain
LQQRIFLYTLFGMTPDAFAVPRRSERKPVKKAVVLMIESDEDDLETRHDGVTVDVSEHGARVEAEAALTPGQTLNLIQPDDPARSLRCMVVWAGNVSSDGHDQVGLEFLDSSQAGLEN